MKTLKKGVADLSFDRNLSSKNVLYIEFALSSNIIFYIAKNPSNAVIYQKLVKVSRYFLFQNKIVVCKSLEKSNDFIKIKRKFYPEENFNLEKLKFFKLWITESLGVFNTRQPNSTSFMLSKVYRCNLSSLRLSHQSITYKEFETLVKFSQIHECDLYHTVILAENGDSIPLEKILKSLPFLKEFRFDVSSKNLSCITSQTASNICQLNNLKDLYRFELFDLPKCFDLKEFAEFIKTYPEVYFTIYYLNLAPADSERFTIIKEEILAWWADFGEAVLEPQIYFARSFDK